MGTTNFDTVAAALVGNVTGNVTGNVVGNVTGNVTGVVTGGTTPATIADPGNAGAIPVTASGRVAIVSAGAETRTLAVPTIVGQRLLIYMKTDGGDAVITVAAAINATGNTIITLNDAGDAIELVAVENGSNKRWVVAFNSGAALS
ncbi:MAG: hypothetical protein IPJ58_16455 [Ardenticatenia bacterium]|nr:hypothetical protein [Ardenticatenia bacterium]